MVRSRKDHETVSAFFRDMRNCNLDQPLPMDSDVTSGVIKAIARDLAAKLGTEPGRLLPSAVACFRGDFEACIVHLRMPVNHRRAVRTTNLQERLFGGSAAVRRSFPSPGARGLFRN